MLCKTVPLRQVHLAQREAELNSDGFPANLYSRKTNQHSFHCGYTSKRLPTKAEQGQKSGEMLQKRERAALTTMLEESRSLFSFQMNFMRFR